MIRTELDRSAREDGGRIRAALAVHFRDLDLAEEAFAEACASAAEAWPRDGAPRDAAAWLYAAARRKGVDLIRRRQVRAGHSPDAPPPGPTPEELVMAAEDPIPDERLRLIFICCHPAVAPEARAALTLRMVCGLSTAEIAEAFLTSEATLAQRLVRAKRKIAGAGVPFETPGPEAWPERMDAVLSTIEVAYAQAHADAAGAGPHAGYAEEMLRLTGLLARLAPRDAEAAALAATVRYAEARRPARLDDAGAACPLSEQDVRLWRADLIEEAEALLRGAAARGKPGPRALQAAIHSAHVSRRNGRPTPWPDILALYDALLVQRDDAVVRVNRAVALAEVEGPEAALAEIDALAMPSLAGWLPWLAARADMFRRMGRADEAVTAYEAALAAGPAPAERLFLARRMAACAG